MARRLTVLVLLLVACSQPSASPMPTRTAAPSVTPIPPTPLPTPELPLVLVGQLARIMLDSPVFEGPATSEAPIGTLAAGELVTVADGPRDLEGGRMWQVEVGALTGWVADMTADGSFALLDAGEPASQEWNVWAAITDPTLPAAVADLPVRIYVPNEGESTVTVIDVATLEVIDTLPVGMLPEHVTPDWDLSRLYVSNYASAFLSTIDAQTGELIDPVMTPNPYNLYFTPDGTTAIVMAEEIDRIDFYDRATWEPLGQIPIAFRGIDHADFSAGGRYLLATTEYTGHVLKVDVPTMTIVGDLVVGGQPIDVKLSPDGSVFYVANQGRHGVSVIDPVTMTEVDFLETGTGAHGMAISRDTRSLYVANRVAGTISVIDFATRSIVETWTVGGSPDMLNVSADGSLLWASNRRDTTIVGIDTARGVVAITIEVGDQPHGLTIFPQPGRFSLGHNGVYR